VYGIGATGAESSHKSSSMWGTVTLHDPRIYEGHMVEKQWKMDDEIVTEKSE